MRNITEIPPKVREIVKRRDNFSCVYCGTSYQLEMAHIVSRAHSGLGVEKNLVLLCRLHHKIFDSGKKLEKENIRNYIGNYIKNIYGEVKKEDVTYKKYSELY